MLEEAEPGIAVLGADGLCGERLPMADVVVSDSCADLDLRLHSARLVATARRNM
jgi:soluble P-type ATPase